MNSVYKSFQYLANKNNGLFVSKKQAEFLTKYATERDGCIGHLMANRNPVFVELDNLGITKMYYQSSTKKGYSDVSIFERTVKGELNAMQIKEIKRLERIVAKVQKEFQRHADAFADGSYNGSGDPSTYINDKYIVNLHKRSQERRTEQIQNLENAIQKIKNN